ncbi:cadherin domain-containing protein [Blastochloris tepida]|uniref:Cadherin domain-containing protein n=1 Tax=Blastochloris tepida TaxID=2233851 RepID=A0A348FZ49_9HYPH|nr:cadherin domain-containing protein [Blastochloris tepida]BBF92582.1 hypothetical protein BLTE_12670 [Blastochloris tepida]
MAGPTTSGAPLNDADLQLLATRQAAGQAADGGPFGADKRIAVADHGPGAQPGATGGDQLTNPNLHYGTQWDDGRGGGQADAHAVPHPAAAPEATPMVESPSIQPLATPAAADTAGEGVRGWDGDAGGLPAARGAGDPAISGGPLGSSGLQPGADPGLGSPGNITATGPAAQGAAAGAELPAGPVLPQETGEGAGSNALAPVITSGEGGQASISLAENTADVATITASDGDAGARLTYTIAGGTDAALFTIDPETGHLVFKSAPDFERPADADGDNIYHVTVQVSDGIHTDTQALAISVTNLQDEAPTGAVMTGGVIAENSAAGTVVGTVTGTDPDAGAVLSYQIVGGDADKYQIDAATGVVSLKDGAKLDFEADAADSITVRVTDQTGLSVEQTFDIKVADVNEAPTGAVMKGDVIAENSAAGTVVGTVSGADADAGAVLSYQIVGGDSDKYQIDAATGVVSLKDGAKLDFEADAADSITVRVTDQTGLSVDQTFDIKVADVNEAPTGAVMKGGVIAENAAAGTVVGTVSGADADAGDRLSYSIVGGDGDKYQIDAATGVVSLKAATKLDLVADTSATTVSAARSDAVLTRTGVKLDYETDAADSITVRVTDRNGLSIDQTFDIKITDVNDAPSGLTVVGGTVQEDVASGGTIGKASAAAGSLAATLAGIDQDAGDKLSYSIVGGDSAKYEILNGNEIHVRAGVKLDYETDPSDSIIVRVTDSHGAIYDRNVVIQVGDYVGSFTGTSAADKVTGTSEQDVISTGGGNDVITGAAGNDRIDGGAGTDTVVYSGASTNYGFTLNADGSVTIGDGRSGSPEGADTVVNVETWQFSDKTETLMTGTTGDDMLKSTAGNDLVLAGDGNDLVYGSGGLDIHDGGAGNDTIDYSALSYKMTIDLDQGLGYVTGYVEGGDRVLNFENAVGGNLADTLIGNAGDNRLDGGAGNDTLTGGQGNDTLIGGQGSDLFVYCVGDGNDSINGGANSGGASWIDQIDLRGGTEALGTYGVDWTVSVTSGAIASVDAAKHEIKLSADADGAIHMQDGSTVSFSDIEKITWA